MQRSRAEPKRLRCFFVGGVAALPGKIMSASGKVLYWVAYDIRSPKRWRKVFQTLKGFGAPVQLSIFACSLTSTQLAKLVDALREVMNLKADCAPVIPLCFDDEVLSKRRLTAVRVIRKGPLWTRASCTTAAPTCFGSTGNQKRTSLDTEWLAQMGTEKPAAAKVIRKGPLWTHGVVVHGLSSARRSKGNQKRTSLDTSCSLAEESRDQGAAKVIRKGPLWTHRPLSRPQRPPWQYR